MNVEHLRAFLWLRWRLRVNQFRKASQLTLALYLVFVGLAVTAAVANLVIGFVVGLWVLPEQSPAVHLLVWDGVIVAFLFCWTVGLLGELQRSEPLALEKVLHLPVSPFAAFLVNYLSSLFSLALIAFVPGMVGMILGQACAGSVGALLLLPLLAAFVLAVTAVSYQFQGWVAALMANPRRRRTVMLVASTVLILITQAPNLLNYARMRSERANLQTARTHRDDQNKAAEDEFKDKKISAEKLAKRKKENQKEFEEWDAEEDRQTFEKAVWIARLGSLVCPPGWLALGASDLAGGAVGAALLGTLGLGLIGVVSLRGACRTTLQLYTGAFTASSRRAAPAPAAPTDPSRVRLLEWRLPWASEQASAVATASFRSLWRAPEAKMALLAPVILAVVFAGTFLSVRMDAPSAGLRPLWAFGVGALVVFVGGVSLIGNQFGYDRNGFRAYILSPVPRREILLGKNLAVAPLALGMGFLWGLMVGIVYPMRIDHYPAVAAQLASAFLLFCLLANAQSILAPIPMPVGGRQTGQVKLLPVLVQFAVLLVIPVVLVPVYLPTGIELLLAEWADIQGWPVSLALSLLVLAGTIFTYGALLTQEGRWLAARERAVLEVVTSTGD